MCFYTNVHFDGLDGHSYHTSLSPKCPRHLLYPYVISNTSFIHTHIYTYIHINRHTLLRNLCIMISNQGFVSIQYSVPLFCLFLFYKWVRSSGICPSPSNIYLTWYLNRRNEKIFNLYLLMCSLGLTDCYILWILIEPRRALPFTENPRYLTR